MNNEPGGATWSAPAPTKRQRLDSLLSQLETASLMAEMARKRCEKLRRAVQDLMEEKS
jgi:hypothetical protein